MKIWKKLGIRTQITVGFLPLILLMSVLSLSAINGMSGLASMFTSYRATAGQSVAVSDYSNRLHEIQLAAESFRTNPSADVVQSFKEGVKAFSLDDPRLSGNQELQQQMVGIRAEIGTLQPGLRKDRRTPHQARCADRQGHAVRTMDEHSAERRDAQRVETG